MIKRSPILGYNHNVKHRGLVFHVQTEDSGVDKAHIFTHLFYGGVILSTRKLDYDGDASEEAIKSLMQAQHKAALRDLKNGRLDEKIDQYLGDTPGLLPSPSRDVVEIEADEPSHQESAPTIADLRDLPLDLPDLPDLDDLEPELPAALDTIPLDQIELIAEEPDPGEPPLPLYGDQILRMDAQPEIDANDPALVHDAIPAELTPRSAGSYSEVRSRGAAPGAPRKVERINTDKIPVIRASTPPPIPEDSGTRRSQRIPARRPGSQSGSIARPPSSRPVPVPPRSPVQSPLGKRARSPSPPPPRAPTPPPRATSPQRNQPGVVVSRPAVIIGAPPKTIGENEPSSSRTASETRRANPRLAREERSRSSLFGKELISEKSLDEVILAYLSEDGAEE